MKNAFDEFISRLDMTEERIRDLEDRSVETSQGRRSKNCRTILEGNK